MTFSILFAVNIVDTFSPDEAHSKPTDPIAVEQSPVVNGPRSKLIMLASDIQASMFLQVYTDP